MKIKFAGLILVASLAALPLSMMTGCAVTSGRESAGEYVDDKTMSTKIKTALTRDPDGQGAPGECHDVPRRGATEWLR